LIAEDRMPKFELNITEQTVRNVEIYFLRKNFSIVSKHARLKCHSAPWRLKLDYFFLFCAVCLLRRSFTRRMPSSPILLDPRFNFMSVYADRSKYIKERLRNQHKTTVLFRKASAKCCAPVAPITLYWRSSVVRVYINNR
jgi:hypothetical protein